MDGITGQFGELFRNKLFLQYLSAAGSDIGNNKPGFDAVNATTQQNIQTENFMKLLQGMLGGKVPEGGKVTMDGKGLSLNVPSAALGEGGFGGLGIGNPKSYTPASMGVPGAGADAGMAVIKPYGGTASVNPFVDGQTESPEPWINPGNLAGLSPDHIQAALGAKLSQDKLGMEREQLAGKRITDIVDMITKFQQIDESKSRMKHADIESRLKEDDRKPVYKIPGTEIELNSKQYIDWQKMNKETQTQAIKNYEYAKQEGYKGTFVEFQDMAKTTHQKEYDQAVKEGYTGDFQTWLGWRLRQGASNINIGIDEQVRRRELFGDVDRRLKVRQPTFHADILEDMQKIDPRGWRASEEVDRVVKSSGRKPEEVRKAIQQDKVFRRMDHEIKSAYPDANFVLGRGWLLPDGTVIQRDPYAQQ